MQDFTGVPGVVDLAAMRDGIVNLKGDPQKVNPLVPVNLVIDHSVMVDFAGTDEALQENITLEFERNAERYAFLRWGQEAFENFSVVPPDTGICHQVNLEYIAQVAWTANVGGKDYVYPDSLYGTDSHTTMINGLGVLGWGVGGIEAEAAMLGQPIAMLIPDVIGFKLTGKLPEGATATDLVLTVTQMLRKKGVVGKFVEFFGPALDHLPVADRATIANMAPEYGATCGFFPVDELTLDFLRQTGRDEHRIKLVKEYLLAQDMFRTEKTPEPVFTDVLELDLSTVVPSLAGPKRPQDRVELKSATTAFEKELTSSLGVPAAEADKKVPVAGTNYELGSGDVVIAAITSCTNTSNPAVLIAAGLVARKARALGLTPKPWVKTSLAPGSLVVTDYLNRSNLTEDLDAMASTRLVTAAQPASATPVRCRATLWTRLKTTTLLLFPSCRVTVTLRGVFPPTCAPTTLPARRWWSPTRCWAPCARTLQPRSLAHPRMASRCTSRTSGLPTRKLRT